MKAFSLFVLVAVLLAVAAMTISASGADDKSYTPHAVTAPDGVTLAV